MREGFGKYTCRDITGKEGHYKEYIGEWIQNQRSGPEGFCRYWNGDAYIGGWLNDKRHGEGGILISSKGDRTVGTWIADLLEGKCVVSLNYPKH